MNEQFENCDHAAYGHLPQDCQYAKRLRPRTLSRTGKARALVDCGEAENMREAREMLEDMGE